jgi:hypothetical protein
MMKQLRLAIVLLLWPLAALAGDTYPAGFDPTGAAINMVAGKIAGTGSGPLASLRGANFNSTADQAIAIPAKITAYHVSKIVVTNCSATPTLAVGGFYNAASKGGTALVAASQAYATLTSAGIGLEAVIVAAGLTGGAQYRQTAANLYLSLTTAAGGASLCDIFVFGDDLS